ASIPGTDESWCRCAGAGLTTISFPCGRNTRAISGPLRGANELIIRSALASASGSSCHASQAIAAIRRCARGAQGYAPRSAEPIQQPRKLIAGPGAEINHTDLRLTGPVPAATADVQAA